MEETGEIDTQKHIDPSDEPIAQEDMPSETTRPDESSPPEYRQPKKFAGIRDVFHSKIKPEDDRPDKQAQPDVSKREDTVNQSQKTLSRRSFLKKLGTTTAAAAAGFFARSGSRMLSPEPAKNAEHLQHLDNVVMIDFAPEKPTTGIRQANYPNNAKLERRLLDKRYKNTLEIIREYGVNPDKKRLIDDYPEFALLHGGLDMYATHGEIVSNAHRTVLEQFGFETVPTVIPIQSAFEGNSSGLEYTDKLGNKGITIEVSSGPLIDQLNNTSQQIVNLSFQMGKIHLVNVQNDTYVSYDIEKHKTLIENALAQQKPEEALYPGKPSDYFFLDRAGIKLKLFVENGEPIYKVVDSLTGEEVHEGFRKLSNKEYEIYKKHQDDQIKRQAHEVKTITYDEAINVAVKGAYSGKEGEENIRELFNLADAHPAKLFIVAAGNYSDDIRPLRESLASEWPQNILIVGQWNKNENKPKSVKGATLGADLYVDNADFGFADDRQYSSVSTAIISAISNIFAARGMSNEEIKKKLIDLSVESEFETDYLDTLAFEPVDFEKYLANIGSENHREIAHVLNLDRLKEFLETAY